MSDPATSALEAETDEEALALLDIPSLDYEELWELAVFYTHHRGRTAPMTDRESFLADVLMDKIDDFNLI